MSIRVCTYNIHKGFSQFNRRMVIHEFRERLHSLDVDLVFLHEAPDRGDLGIVRRDRGHHGRRQDPGRRGRDP